MGEVKNLYDTEAIKKLKEFIDEGSTCFFCSNIANGKFDTRPMSTQKIDEEGNVWFLSGKDSDKNEDIARNNNVQLLYNISSHTGFMTVRGKATVLYDREKVEELWEPIAKVWFPKGKDDDNISIIKVETNDGYYWDTQHGKIVSFVKLVASLATGKRMDDGIKGKMNM